MTLRPKTPRKPAPPRSTLPRGEPQLVTKRSQSTDHIVETVIDTWADRYGLSLSERAVLFAATILVGGHAMIAESLGVMPDTVRTQAGAVCRKTGARGLMEAAVLVLREALNDGI